MNVANSITFVRLLVTALLLACLELMRVDAPHKGVAWLVFGAFLFAATTDAVDGWVARKFGQVTRLGRVIDPFADKVLICGCLISMLRFTGSVENLDRCLQSWMVVVIVAREFLVTTLRGVAESAGVAFPADRFGKLKMIAQCVAVAALLAMIAGAGPLFYWTGLCGMWATVALTVLSGANYVVKAAPVLRAA